jgi:hypothetical protein
MLHQDAVSSVSAACTARKSFQTRNRSKLATCPNPARPPTGFGFLANPHPKKLRKPPDSHPPAATKGTPGTSPPTHQPPGTGGAGAGERAGRARSAGHGRWKERLVSCVCVLHYAVMAVSNSRPSISSMSSVGSAVPSLPAGRSEQIGGLHHRACEWACFTWGCASRKPRFCTHPPTSAHQQNPANPPTHRPGHQNLSFFRCGLAKKPNEP